MAKRRYTDDQLLALHDRLESRDPTASSELADAVFDELVGRLERFSGATPEEAVDAVSLALVNYFKNPVGYDRSKARLRTYLHNAAMGDLLNDREKASKYSREKSVGRVEDHEGGRNKVLAGGGSPDAARPDWLLEVQEAWLRLQREFPNPRDREVIQLMLAGERNTRTFAEALGLTDLPAAEQRKLVKQHKDRIQKRLDRLRERLADGQ